MQSVLDSFPPSLLLALAGGATLALSLFLNMAFARFAPRLGLIDRPNHERKLHTGEPALTGGLAIYFSVVIACNFFAPRLIFENPALFVAGFLLLLTGAIDDRHDIPAIAKLCVQLAAAGILIYVGNAVLVSLGVVVPHGKPFALGVFAVPFTMVAVLLLLNAWNMTDGLDGLIGGITLCGLLWMGAAILGAHMPMNDLWLPAILFFAVLGYLPFNLRSRGTAQRQVFLGDAGSLFLGLCMAWLPLKLTQDRAFLVPPAVMAWILTVPVFDITWVVFTRLAHKKNPMSPDKTHLHHLLMAKGYTAAQAARLIVAISFICGGLGVLLWVWHMPAWTLMAGWAVGWLAFGAVRYKLGKSAL